MNSPSIKNHNPFLFWKKKRRGPDYFRLPGGILIHGNRIWFSEAISMVLVCLIVLFLLWAMPTIILNETRIGHQENTIARTTAANLELWHQIKKTRSKTAIVSALQTMVGKRMSDTTIQVLAALIYDNSTAYGYDPLLVLAVIRVESVFNPRALGAYQSGELSGALGLMQLKVETAQDMADMLQMGTITTEDLMQPHINLALGVAYLTRMIAQFKSFKLGLLAYNQGPETIRLSLVNAVPLSTRYYTKVLKSYYEIGKMVE